MGIVSEMRWPHWRNGSSRRVVVGEPVVLPIRSGAELTVNKELAVNETHWAALMLRISALVIILFQSAYLLNELYSLGYRPTTLGLHLFNILVACLALAASFRAGGVRHWRGFVLAMCWAVIAGTTAINAMLHEDLPLFIAALLFSTGAGCLIPWEERWQAALNVFALAAFAIDEALIQAHGPYLYFRWLGMLSAVVIAQLAAHLAGIYRRGLAARYEALARSERKIADSEAKLRKIFESTSDAISIFSLVDGHFVEVNSEFTRVTGYTREEALAATHGNLPIWGGNEQRRRFLQELKANGALRNMEIQVRNRNGTLAPSLISGSTVELDGARCAIAIARDITALKRAQDELVAAHDQALGASRAKSEFLSSMSHEIRTPMNAILGMAEVLWETNLDADQRRYLDTMRSNGATLLSLLDDILDLAKVDSGRLRLKEVEFDLGDLVEKTIETLAVRAHGKGLELVARVAPGTPARLMGDPLRLRQVMVNLLGNAIKFTELGDIVLTVAPDNSVGGNFVRFSAADTGIGIEPDKLGAMFSDFTQADSSNTRKYGGSGLGLAIAWRLVSLMGGRIWAESKPGTGSTFHFTAPLKAAESVGQVRQMYDLNPLRVLVADRNATNRQIFAETLGSCGVTVEETATVQETIKALGNALRLGCPFDVVFGDYQMPGIEEIERLAEDGCTCGAGMIIPMLTTDDLMSKLTRLRRFGFQSHLLKPVRRSDLIEVISHAARRLRSGALPAPTLSDTALPGTTSPTAAPGAAVRTSRRSLRILLAEDSPDNRLLITAYFKRLPYRIETAENGNVAVEKFTSGRYDLILMDIQMPVMDGYTAVRIIRAWETEHRRPTTPILALTASTLDDDIRRAFEAGCNKHIAKPVRKAALLEAIDETLKIAGVATTPKPTAAALRRSHARVNGPNAPH